MLPGSNTDPPADRPERATSARARQSPCNGNASISGRFGHRTGPGRRHRLRTAGRQRSGTNPTVIFAPDRRTTPDGSAPAIFAVPVGSDVDLPGQGRGNTRDSRSARPTTRPRSSAPPSPHWPPPAPRPPPRQPPARSPDDPPGCRYALRRGTDPGSPVPTPHPRPLFGSRSTIYSDARGWHVRY